MKPLFARPVLVHRAALLCALAGASVALAEEPAEPEPDATPVYDVYVTSPRDLAEQVATVRRLDHEDMEQESARTLDEAMVHVPNVVVRTGGDGVPRIDVRGLRSRHLTLLVDGVPYNSTADGQFDPSLIPTQLIDRIDLVTSNSSVLYGDGGIGGVLQIRTRKPSPELSVTSDVDVRTRGQYQPETSVSGTWGGLETFLAGHYLHSQGYQMSDDFDATSIENGNLRENSDREQGNFFGKLGYAISPELRVDVMGDYRNVEFGVPPNVVDDPDDRFAPRTRFERVENLDGFTTQLSGQYDPEGPFSLRSWGFVNRQKEDRRRYDDESYDTIVGNGSFSIDETALVSGGALHGAYDLSEFGAIRLAVNGRYERYETDGRRCVISGGGGGGGGGGGAATTCGTALGETPFTRVDTEDDLGVVSVGAEYEVEPLAGLGLTVGYSHAFLEGRGGVDDNGSIFLGGATWELPTETRLWGSAAHKIRFPSIVQLYEAEGGNTGLDTERCWCFEVGVEQILPWSTRVAVTGFWQELKDFIERDGDTRIYENLQKLRIRGAEVALASRPWEPLLLRFAYSYLHTKDRSSDADFPRLPNRPKHTIDFEGRYTHPWNGDLRVGVRYLKGIEQDSRNEPYELMNLDDFTLVDVRISQRFQDDRFELYFGVDNIFDEEAEVNFGFPMAGRTYLGGGIVRF